MKPLMVGKIPEGVCCLACGEIFDPADVHVAILDTDRPDWQAPCGHTNEDAIAAVADRLMEAGHA